MQFTLRHRLGRFWSAAQTPLLVGDYLWADGTGEITPTDLTLGAAAGQGFTIVNASEITPTTTTISADLAWVLDGNLDLTPTT